MNNGASQFLVVPRFWLRRIKMRKNRWQNYRVMDKLLIGLHHGLDKAASQESSLILVIRTKQLPPTFSSNLPCHRNR